MMLGLKHVETRGWECQYRGPLVIHVAKNRTGIDHMSPRLMNYFLGTGYGVDVPWPLGCAVGIVDVIDCQKAHLLKPSLSEMEIAFGDYRRFGDDGKQRYGIITVNPRPFPKPIQFPGKQGFFEFPDGLIPKEVLNA